MYAIVEIAGQQFKVAKDQKVFVHRLEAQEGSSVSFDNVLLASNGETVTIGAPAITGASVEAKVLRHLKGDKVIVFKKKRRKGYRVKNGHRQYLTEIQIQSIVTDLPQGASAQSEAKQEPKKETAVVENLEKIEGIGPKIAEIFNNAGITTFEALANAEIDKLKEILAAAGPRFASKNPNSWPKQARMAAEGKWDELQVWQDSVHGGIEK